MSRKEKHSLVPLTKGPRNLKNYNDYKYARPVEIINNNAQYVILLLLRRYYTGSRRALQCTPSRIAVFFFFLNLFFPGRERRV